MLIRVIHIMCTALVVACAANPVPPKAPLRTQTQISEVETVRTVITPEEATSVAELFERARLDLEEGRAKQAAQGFDRVVRLDPEGPFTTEALFKGATAHEALQDREAAAHRFEQLARRFSGSEYAREALLRAIRLYVHEEYWSTGSELGQLLLSRFQELGPRELIVAYGARALFAVSEEQVEDAEYYVNKARQIVEQHRLDSAGTIPRDLAQLFFALGEVRRLKGEAIQFEKFSDFAERFEQRAQLLLDAQSAYSDAMRAYDAHWTTMAGFRVGELYGKLHRDVMAMPRPKKANTPRKEQLYEGALRLRYSVLLTKGLDMIDHTLAMAERTNEESAWVERAREAKRELKQAVESENQALDALPFSRADMQAVLDDIARRQTRPVN